MRRINLVLVVVPQNMCMYLIVIIWSNSEAVTEIPVNYLSLKEYAIHLLIPVLLSDNITVTELSNCVCVCVCACARMCMCVCVCVRFYHFFSSLTVLILSWQGNLGTQTSCRIRRNSNNLSLKTMVQLGEAQGSPKKLVVGVREVPHQRKRK
jgi:hypothetical protein